jgi:hypothetical protein
MCPKAHQKTARITGALWLAMFPFGFHLAGAHLFDMPSDSRASATTRGGFGLVEEVIPFHRSHNREIYGASERWNRIHDALSRELGVHELSPRSNG